MIHILILEDNAQDVKMIKRHLDKTLNYVSVQVDNRNDFLKELNGFNPDIIISDYFLPEFNGLEALKLRNEIQPETPFIIVTVSINEETAASLIKKGATDYVTKEHLTRLPAVINNALKERKILREKLKKDKELVERELLFRKFIENDISGDYVEQNGKIIFCNKKIFEIFGFDSLEELNDYGTKNLYNDINDRKRFYETLKSKGKVTGFEVTMHDKNGKTLYLEENAFIEYDKNGNPEYIFGYIFDRTQQKENELKLKESETLFRSLTENTAAGIIIYDDKKIYYTNKTLSSILGYTKEEFLKKRVIDLIHPDFKNMVRKKIEDRIHGQRNPEQYDVRLLTKNNKTVWINGSTIPFFYKGKPAAIATIIDITEKKFAEDRIKNNTKRLNTLVTILESNIKKTDKILKFSLEKIIEFSESKLGAIFKPDKVSETFTPVVWKNEQNDNNNNNNWINEIFDTEIPAKVLKTKKTVIENNFEKKYNAERNISNILIFPVFEEENIVSVIAVANKDTGYTDEDAFQIRLLTDAVWKEVAKIKIDEELRKKNEDIKLLYLALNRSPLSIVVTDYNGNIEYTNDFFTQITGYSPGEVLGQNPRILQSGKTPKDVYPMLWKKIKSGETWEGEFINRKKNGDEYVERAIITPVFDNSGKIIKFIAVKEDITLKKEYEKGLLKAKEKAEEANKLKTNFLANISHELRTPLNGILGFAELMESENDINSLKDMSKYIKISSMRLMNTLNLIIDYSIISAEKINLIKHKFDIVTLIKQIVNNYATSAKSKGLFLNLQSDSPAFIINSDSGVIEKIVTNLVDNAVKFTKKGGVSIIVNTAGIQNNGHVKISVKDTGKGIETQYKDVIFEPFRQVSEGYARTFEGIGLGLSVSKKFVEALGGKIWFDSKKNAGTVFHILIPVD